MTGILALIQALPAFLEMMSRLGLLVEKFMKVAETNNLNKWIHDLEEGVDALETAKTTPEKLEAARKLSSVIRKL